MFGTYFDSANVLKKFKKVLNEMIIYNKFI